MPSDRPPRSFLQVELVTTYREGSIDFYAWLLGLGGTDTQERLEALGSVGIADIRLATRANESTGWIPTFWVPDVAAALAGSQATAVHNHESPRGGSSGAAYVRDEFHVWSAVKDSLEGIHDASALGRASLDYLTTDVDVVVAFYTSLLSVQSLEYMEDPWDMKMLRSGTDQISGVLSLRGRPGSIPTGWIIYFELNEDVTVVAIRCVESGARILIPTSRSSTNCYAILEDPYGQIFGLSRMFSPKEVAPIPVREADGGVVDVRALLPGSSASPQPDRIESH